MKPFTFLKAKDYSVIVATGLFVPVIVASILTIIFTVVVAIAKG